MTSPYADAPPRDAAPAIGRWARIALTLVLVPLGFHAFADQYGSVPMVSDIDVAIHEFGHMLFMPFGILILGKTVMILGGSLIQVVVPLLFVGYFLYAKGQRDLHAAMVCLWWVSMNVLSVAIYVGDSRAEVLTLINGLTGQESDGHDWNNLLTTWHALDKDTVIAGRMRAVAWVLFTVSILVGLMAAWNSGNPPAESNNLTDPAAPPARRRIR